MSKFIDSNVLRWVSYQATVELERKLRTGELFPGHISFEWKKEHGVIRIFVCGVYIKWFNAYVFLRHKKLVEDVHKEMTGERSSDSRLFHEKISKPCWCGMEEWERTYCLLVVLTMLYYKHDCFARVYVKDYPYKIEKMWEQFRPRSIPSVPPEKIAKTVNTIYRLLQDSYNIKLDMGKVRDENFFLKQ